MKTSFPVLLLTLAINATVYASPFSVQDDDIEKAISSTLFTKIDANKDGKVSFDEIFSFRTESERERNEAQANELFTKCDKNKDGKVDGDELVKMSMEEFSPQMMEDPNGCHVPAEILDFMDSDGDGFITKNELLDNGINRRRPPKKLKAKMAKKEKQRMTRFQREQFERCDKDKDEFLTLREAASMNCNIYTEMFDARDKNADALISKEEMMADVKPPQFENSRADNVPNNRDFERNMPASALLSMKISRCDKNDNSKLELTETGGKDCVVDLALFNTTDQNSDSAIDDKEIDRMRMKETFDELDTNKDGWLDKKEFKGSRVRYM